MPNFAEYLKLVKANDVFTTQLDLQQEPSLSYEQLEELNTALASNNQVCRISWYQSSNFYLKNTFYQSIESYVKRNNEQFIERFFTKKTLKTKQLLLEIRLEPLLAELVRIPLFRDVLQVHWYQKPLSEDSINLTELYNYFFQEILKYSLGKRNIYSSINDIDSTKVSEFLKTEVSILEDFAWQVTTDSHALLLIDFSEYLIQFIEQKYGFEGEQLKKTVSAVLDIELLDVRTKIKADAALQNSLFKYIGMQDFLAARYIVRLLIKQPDVASDLIARYKFDKKLQEVWSYVAGILDLEAKLNLRSLSSNNSKQPYALIEHYFDLFFNEEPREIFGLYTTELMAAFLAKAPLFQASAKGQQYLRQLEYTIKSSGEYRENYSSISDVFFIGLANIAQRVPLMADLISDYFCYQIEHGIIDNIFRDRWIYLSKSTHHKLSSPAKLMPPYQLLLKNDKSVTKDNAAKASSELILYLEPKERLTLLQALLDVIKLGNEFNKNAVIESVRLLFPYLNAEELSLCLQALLAELANSDFRLKMLLIETLKQIALYLHPEEQLLCLRSLQRIIESTDGYIKERALITFSSIIPYLVKEVRTEFVNFILKLPESSIRVDAIRLLFPYLTHEQQAECLTILLNMDSHFYNNRGFAADSVAKSMPYVIPYLSGKKRETSLRLLFQLLTTDMNREASYITNEVIGSKEAIGKLFPVLNLNERNSLLQLLVSNALSSTFGRNATLITIAMRAVSWCIRHANFSERSIYLSQVSLLLGHEGSAPYFIELMPYLSDNERALILQTLLDGINQPYDLLGIFNYDTIAVITLIFPTSNHKQQTAYLLSLFNILNKETPYNIKAAHAISQLMPYLSNQDRLSYLPALFQSVIQHGIWWPNSFPHINIIEQIMPYLSQEDQHYCLQKYLEPIKIFTGQDELVPWFKLDILLRLFINYSETNAKQNWFTRVMNQYIFSDNELSKRLVDHLVHLLSFGDNPIWTLETAGNYRLFFYQNNKLHSLTITNQEVMKLLKQKLELPIFYFVNGGVNNANNLATTTSNFFSLGVNADDISLLTSYKQQLAIMEKIRLSNDLTNEMFAIDYPSHSDNQLGLITAGSTHTTELCEHNVFQKALVIDPRNDEAENNNSFEPLFNLAHLPKIPLPSIELNSQLALANVGIYAIRTCLNRSAQKQEKSLLKLSIPGYKQQRRSLLQQLDDYQEQLKHFAKRVNQATSNEVVKMALSSIQHLNWLIKDYRQELDKQNKISYSQFNELQDNICFLASAISELKVDYYNLQKQIASPKCFSFFSSSEQMKPQTYNIIFAPQTMLADRPNDLPESIEPSCYLTARATT